MEEIWVESALSSPARGILLLGMDGMKERLGYEELIAPVRERMMRIIWRIVRHPDEAEDTMQEVLTLVWKKLDRISRHPHPQALVLRMCVNASVDTLRKQRRRGRFVGSEVIGRLPDAAAGSERHQAETEGMVKRAIGRLPRKQAVAVVMRILEGYSYKEIAGALGCRETTARTHVLRGRAKLSHWLSHLRPSLSKENVP
ncbi:MAG TPA: RNA polymerase sigma factor [Candidatus Desulfaltia sp.]|nr:RNA polymerase sigma factor [Candidatus Desulfaltia sp.]